MTRDEILAAIDAQQALLDQAVTDIETATAAKVAAEVAIADGEARRGAAQLELARLVEALANVPPEADWRRFGCRRTDLNEWSARIGLDPVCVQTFSNDQPFTQGKVPGRPDSGYWLAQITYPFGGKIVRGKTAKLADVRAQRDALRAVGNGQRDVMLRRGLEAIGQVINFDTDMIRIDNERCVNWFWYGSGLEPNQYITRAQADVLRVEIADAHRAADERLMALAAEVFGADYSKVTWDICVAGNFGDVWRQDLLRREWPRRVPDGTRINLGTDAYVRARGDTNRLRSNLAGVDVLSVELPFVVSKSIDEWGPHNSESDSKATLDVLVAEKQAFVAETVRWMRADHPVPVAHVALYETPRPNGRPESTVLFADRDQRKPPAMDPDDVIIFPSRAGASFVARNGERVPSNDPEMAEALLAALWED